MLGWHISVYRKAEDRLLPGTQDAQCSERVAVWQARINGLAWLDDVVAQGMALHLGGNGYPYWYTAQARHLIPRILVDRRRRVQAGFVDLRTSLARDGRAAR